MKRIRALLMVVLTLAVPNLAQAKIHLFRRKHPTYSPGGHLLGKHQSPKA